MSRDSINDDKIDDIFLTDDVKGLEKEWRHFLYVPSTAIRNYFGE